MLYGTDARSVDRLRFIGGGAQHAFASRVDRGTRSIDVASEFAQFAGVPVGYRPGEAIFVPIKDGGLGASTSGAGLASVTAALAALGIVVSASNGVGTLTAAGNIGALIAGAMAGSGALSVTVDAAGRIVATVRIGFQPSADDNAFALLDTFEVEPGFTVRQALRLIMAATAGKVSGAAGSTVTIRNAADTKNRIVATVDSNGNRSAVTYDLSS